jgi:histone deacetylase complex regulatory component SIN3
LEILHEYQAKRTIDEVYGRVQKLFGGLSLTVLGVWLPLILVLAFPTLLGQPDLLDEFKYFLPDVNAPNQATPKRQQKKKETVTNTKNMNRGSKVPKTKSGLCAALFLCRFFWSHSKFVPFFPSVSYPSGSEKDIQLFDKIKQSLPKTLWEE